MPSLAVATVLGDEQCWCLWKADEVGAPRDLCQVFLLLGWVLGQVLTCSEVTGQHRTHQSKHQVECFASRKN